MPSTQRQNDVADVGCGRHGDGEAGRDSSETSPLGGVTLMPVRGLIVTFAVTSCGGVAVTSASCEVLSVAVAVPAASVTRLTDSADPESW